MLKEGKKLEGGGVSVKKREWLGGLSVNPRWGVPILGRDFAHNLHAEMWVAFPSRLYLRSSSLYCLCRPLRSAPSPLLLPPASREAEARPPGGAD